MRNTIGILPIMLNQWPAQDSANWRSALVPGGFLADGGALAGRPERDLKRIQYCFGVWLAFLMQRHSNRVLVSGLDHFDPAELKPLLQLLDSRLAPFSVLSFLTGLRDAARAMASERDFPLLEQAVRHYNRVAKPAADKRERLRTPQELFALGFRLMAQPQRATARMRFTNQYRDGLAIAMLISMPLRISNFGSLQLDKSIQRIGDRYWIFVEKTKNGRPMEFALPLQLTQPIDLYLEQHRPYLLARGKHTLREAAGRAFWISSDGTALTSQLLGKRISDRTRDAFGRSVNPHLFRDAAATAIASEDPEHVGIILPILGHASLRVSEKHYNHAKSLQSARRYHDVLQGIIDSAGE